MYSVSSESSPEESFKEIETRATYSSWTHRVSSLTFRHVSLDIQARIIGSSPSGSAKSIEAVTYQLFYYEASIYPSTITNTRISTRTCWALFSSFLSISIKFRTFTLLFTARCIVAPHDNKWKFLYNSNYFNRNM